MKIRMLVDVSGTRDGQSWPARGETVDVPDTEGAGLCAAGIAQPVAEPDADVETTVPEDDTEQRQESSGMTTQTAAALGLGATGFYDPAGYNVTDVLAYLAEADEDEVLRVLDAEVAGKDRAGIVGKRDEIMARFEGEG